MQTIARLRREAMFGFFGFVLAIAGCSGGKAYPCAGPGFSEGGPSGTFVSPGNGTTGVSTAVTTIVYAGLTQYPIVLEPTSGATYVRTTATALPSPLTSDGPSGGTTNGDYAVSVPALNAATTYAVGTLSDVLASCVGDDQFYRFGNFTTQ